MEVDVHEFAVEVKTAFHIVKIQGIEMFKDERFIGESSIISDGMSHV